MADNYLEKKMEEHRQGVKPVFRRSPSGNKPHTFAFPCTIRNAFIIGNEQLDDILLACAMTIRDTSCRVAFCCTDKVFGSTTAQKYGLQYYPIQNLDSETIEHAIELATTTLGNMDVVIRKRQNTIIAEISGRRSYIDIDKECASKIAATAVVYLTLPQSISLALGGNFNLNKDGILSVVKD